MKERIWLFGAGASGLATYRVLAPIYEIAGVLDNDRRKHGKPFCKNIQISSPHHVDLSEIRIVIASVYCEAIFQQLKALGAKRVEIFPNLSLSPFDCPKDEALCAKIDEAVLRLYERLITLERTTNLYPLLFNYSLILYRLLNENRNIRFLLDFGSTGGLLSLLSNAYGLSDIYYSSSSSACCEALKRTAQELKFPGQRCICANIQAVVTRFQKNGFLADAICCPVNHATQTDSRRESLFRTLSQICEPRQGIVCFFCDICNHENKDIQLTL